MGVLATGKGERATASVVSSSTYHFTFAAGAVKSRLSRSGELGCRLVLMGQSLTVLGFAPLKPVATHRVRDRVHADRPPGLKPVGMHARRAVGALGCAEHLRHLGVQVGRRCWPHSGRQVEPLVEPGLAHPEDYPAHRIRHAVKRPQVGDEACQAHFVTRFTHRTTERLRPQAPCEPGVLASQPLQLVGVRDG
jgi:hypothetical protein